MYILCSNCSKCSKQKAGVLNPAFFVSFCQSILFMLIFFKIVFLFMPKKSHKCHKKVNMLDF